MVNRNMKRPKKPRKTQGEDVLEDDLYEAILIGMSLVLFIVLGGVTLALVAYSVFGLFFG